MPDDRPEFNFEEDIAIDLDDLHEEWRMHAHKRHEYAKEVSHLERVMKKAWEHTKVIRSKLIKEAKGKGFGNAILQEAYYRDHEDHKAAKQAHIDAEYNLSMAWNALRAMDDRKFALENEVELWKRNYFATPREERIVDGGKRVMDTIKNKTETKQRESLKERSRRRRG